MTRDPRFPRDHLTALNRSPRMPPGGWIIPCAILGAGIWGAVFMWLPI